MKIKLIYIFNIVFIFGATVFPSFANSIRSYRTLRYQSVVGQTNYYTCGAAAVATLFTHYYGQPTSETEILQLSEKAMIGSGKNPQKTGITVLALKQALSNKGIKARGMELTLESLVSYFRQGGLPVILHVTKPQLHYVAAVGAVGDYIVLADPSIGRRIITVHALVNESGFNGVTLVPLLPESIIPYTKKQQKITLTWAESRLIHLNFLKRRSL